MDQLCDGSHGSWTHGSGKIIHSVSASLLLSLPETANGDKWPPRWADVNAKRVSPSADAKLQSINYAFVTAPQIIH